MGSSFFLAPVVPYACTMYRSFMWFSLQFFALISSAGGLFSLLLSMNSLDYVTIANSNTFHIQGNRYGHMQALSGSPSALCALSAVPATASTASSFPPQPSYDLHSKAHADSVQEIAQADTQTRTHSDCVWRNVRGLSIC